MKSIEAIIDRLVADPDFLERLTEDPVGTLQDEGFDLSALSSQELKAVGKATEPSWEDLVEVLQQRISRMGITGTSFRPPGSH